MIFLNNLKIIKGGVEYFEEFTVTSTNNKLLSSFRCFSKRVFDMIISLISILLLLPFLIILSIIIKINSKGDIFFVQDRFGKDGKVFKLVKFKTMYRDADKRLEEYFMKNPQFKKEWKQYKKLKTYDPRITVVGKFLRRFSLDELPQFFNVLKGEMSIVGPRPYLVQEKKEIRQFSDVIFKVKPGITGVWQVKGRNELSFKSRIKMEIFYVQNLSLFLDIIIILKTFRVVIKGEGAY